MRRIRHCLIRGALSEYTEGFRAELERLGYTGWSREYKVNQASRLSRWLVEQGLTAGDLDDARLAAFFATMATAHCRPPTVAAFKPLLEFLRAQGVPVPTGVAEPEPCDGLMSGYRRWMITERGLSDRTIERYEKTARRFVREHAATGGGIETLTAQAVTGFLLAEASRGLARGSLVGRVAELRSLLRFLYVKGFTDAPLAQVVPPVPSWKGGAVPPRLPAAQVDALLVSCDRGTAAGIRDLAMLTLMARLGLRAAEVAGLVLDDLHWRSGELVVHGKGRREDLLPLPTEAGEAVACYLRDARPSVESRVVFVTVVAPHRRLRPTAVSQMVWRQCRRAGLAPMRAHCLRHALATDLLERGLRLPEIGQLLRQSDLATTAGYAKVDYAALRELALPWPGTRR